MKTTLVLLLLLFASPPLRAQPSLHPGGPSAEPRHAPTNPREMDEDERAKREDAAQWLILRLGGGVALGVGLLGGAVLIGRRKRVREEASS